MVPAAIVHLVGDVYNTSEACGMLMTPSNFQFILDVWGALEDKTHTDQTRIFSHLGINISMLSVGLVNFFPKLRDPHLVSVGQTAPYLSSFVSAPLYVAPV